MKKVVVDASVAIKWFVPEIHSAAAARLLDPAISIYAPDLIGPEIGNTLWKKVRRGEITADEATEILNAFTNVPLEISPTAPLLSAALELAIALDRTVYDSVYLALAVSEEGVLITADAKFHAALKSTGLAAQIQWIEADT